MTAEIYISCDIETDGPIPGPHSMLSLGAAAFTPDTFGVDDPQPSATFTVNLQPLDGAAPHPDTQAWWERQDPAVYAAARDGAIPAEQAMRQFDAWVRSLDGKPVFVAYPAGYDFTFVYWYLHRFVGNSVFSHSAFDMKTHASQLLGIGYRQVGKRRMAKRWPVNSRHTHVALDDAIEQGQMFAKMMGEPRR